MTTDKLTQALVDLLDANKPHASLTVTDARSLDDIELPTIAVDCGDPEPHSLAMPGVQRVPVSIVLRAHAGDDADRPTLKSWADSIEKLINQPETVRDYITASGNGLACHMIQFASGGTSWDQSVFEARFNGDAMTTRTS